MAASKKKCCECGETYACGGTMPNESKPPREPIWTLTHAICIKRVRYRSMTIGLSTMPKINVQFNPSYGRNSQKHSKTFIVYANMMRQDEYHQRAE